MLVAWISCSLPANQQVKHEYCIPEEGSLANHTLQQSALGSLRLKISEGKALVQHGEGHARPNAFDKCEQLDQPKWLRFLPADANDLWREDFLEPAPKASNAFAAGMVHKHSARKLRQVKCANIE